MLLSGAVGLEPTTCGFGDRRSTNWAIRLYFTLPWSPCGQYAFCQKDSTFWVPVFPGCFVGSCWWYNSCACIHCIEALSILPLVSYLPYLTPTPLICPLFCLGKSPRSDARSAADLPLVLLQQKHSPRSESNWWPYPYHGYALPTELQGRNTPYYDVLTK